MSQSNYVLGRDYLAATRLNLQHFLWKQNLGYCVHPGIPVHREGLCIADVGTGTGSWLLDVGQNLPPSAQLEGFDISADQFPQKEWLPNNISFHIQDATQEPPVHLHERFDIVHLRLFLAVVNDNDPTPVLNHCLKLLKPGGYLQWDETDSTATEVVSTHDPDSAHSFHSFLNAINAFKPMQWVKNLGDTFADQCLENVLVHRSREHAWQRTMFNQLHCILAEEYTLSLLAHAGPSNVGDEKSLLARNMYAEAQQGSGWSSLFQVVVGQKVR